MTLTPRHQSRAHTKGLTLIETTLVIALILGLIGIVFIGADAFKRGSDRAICILQVTDVQKAMRSYCNLNEYFPGENVSDLKGKIIGPGRFLRNPPECPSGGLYEYVENTVPALGQSFVECSLGQHEPVKSYYW